MFDELPETNPSRNLKKRKAFLGAAGVQAALVAAIIVIQMAMPERLGEFQLLTTLYMAPPPPPPALGPAPAPTHKAERKVAATRAADVVAQTPQPTSNTPDLVAPAAVPAELPKVIDPPSTGVIGGLPGGVPGGQAGGTSGGILGGVLGGAGQAPPVELPQGPVRIGGDVKQPKVVKIVEPKYPPEARRGRIEGIVIIEATVTEEGVVDKVKVISGHPLLSEAAAEAVQQWRYEPTYLNGKPVPVILTAKVTFQLTAGK